MSRVPAGTVRSGVTHVNVADDEPPIEVAPRLARHPGLSLLAIGLAVHIQSLPEGSRIGIKALAERFPEGEVRVAGGLRELEAAGYLERRRVRTADGRLVTRTVFYSRPKPPVPPPHEPPHEPAPAQPPPPAGRASLPGRERVPERVAVPGPGPMAAPRPVPEPVAAPGAGVPAPAPVRKVMPPPEPPEPRGPVRQEAVALLARLRGDDPRLLLGERDVCRLAPGVTAWLERGAEPETVRRVLAAGLPADMRSPAALIGYRLRVGLPPELPREEPAPPAARKPDPMQNCDGCDRGFRAPAPGRCNDCPPEDVDAAVPGQLPPRVA
ncbi:helix-turn-helix domain-containing protein [Streptomyces sp. NPDC001546]|uniref:helix-turn-helix domain-containing protein n=1 Tax=Streptomyces sp. NPDC001546 TaxID=3364585 RepID=UPI00367EEDAE